MAGRDEGLILACAALALAACAAAEDPAPDPAAGPIRLEAKSGFRAQLLHAGDVGVWTVGAADVLPAYAGDEVVGLDDEGRVIVLVRYSGRTLARYAVLDGTWLGGLAHGDVDPTVPGCELYVGAQRGNLYQVVAHPQGGFDSVVVAYFPGAEVHSLLAVRGHLFAGLSSGEIHEVRPGSTPRLVHRDPGRIRQMIDLGDGTIAYASRSGRAVLLEPSRGWRATTILAHSDGLARIARGEHALYAIADDGKVFRLRDLGRGWSAETIFEGPVGGRGIAAGRFHEDPERETVAIFGYSGRVQLLTREDDGTWSAKTIFRDADKGHWLSAAELDARNETTELLLSGYSGRIVLLTR